MTTVYFATNRKKNGPGARDFGSAIVAQDADLITYAVAEVDHVQLPDEDSGAIGSIHDLSTSNFNDATRDAIVNAGHNLLVFIHGASNSFDDAIKRAAFNREWFAAGGEAAARTTVVAFTWPSANIGIGHAQPGYKRDQGQAGKSGFHLQSFLKNVVDLRRQMLALHPQAQVFLLAHSMGNHALRAGIESWFEAHGPDELIFDQVFLAAPDEEADVFEHPGSGLSNLPQLSDRISIYFSREDRLMWLSADVNNNKRLGGNGPTSKMDPDRYPEAKFRLLDCTLVLDYSLIVPADASHQYYRRSEAVRADIVACMVDDPRPEGGLIAMQAGQIGGVDPGTVGA